MLPSLFLYVAPTAYGTGTALSSQFVNKVQRCFSPDWAKKKNLQLSFSSHIAAQVSVNWSGVDDIWYLLSHVSGLYFLMSSYPSTK